jgi:hypothetical protein
MKNILVVGGGFKGAIIDALHSGPLRTKELYASVRGRLPLSREQKQDSGYAEPKWQHRLRATQQVLKEKGIIRRAKGKWSLCPGVVVV